MSWVTLISFTYPHEAHIAISYLKSEGLDTIIKDELTTQVDNFYSNAIGGVKILVRESDYQRGIDLLKESDYITDESKDAAVEAIEIDSERNKKICPYCSSENIGKNKQTNIIAVLLYFIIQALLPIFKTSYTCFDCDKKWRYIKK